ncbi:dienelactone hydrolase [Eremomyces bilateralis CBS 781.70]|uniref:Dienelactone hydrolase n=1 Tax=Eremomyces bilateralis CBS 781.70 TaxID=1392243 RepID=A0A6G1GA47_9PEZI|nr:dienelactone hydrolase [Eremomyces bilateralis CBS 781.70]KAF1814872.1 dienelactone hydrolase [Eremomyces bilateralis CBS 781.70]
MAQVNVSAGGGGLGLLSRFNNGNAPLLYIAAEEAEEDFDQTTIQLWKEEGFLVEYLPYLGTEKEFAADLHQISAKKGLGDYFAVLAFGDAAAVCLEVFRKNTPKLCALVAYYPTSIPDPHSTFPISTRVVVHLAGSEVGVTRNPQVLGIQGKRRTITKRINGAIGVGGRLQLAYPSYTYANAGPGFAEHDLPEYDKVSERLAWTRSLDAMRKGFRLEVELEKVWEEHLDYEFKHKDAAKTIATMVSNPYVNHIPTLTGGIGREDLFKFYEEFFIPSNPPSLSTRLVSRTVGVDKVVDEMIISFKHTCEVDWMLPGVPPTDKDVEVALVSVVKLRGGKLCHEHIYWDQASVLVQVGLLDPKMVPQKFKDRGLERLPVSGKEAALKVVDEDSIPSNLLILDWDGE